MPHGYILETNGEDDPAVDAKCNDMSRDRSRVAGDDDLGADTPLLEWVLLISSSL